jgi:hypothetical protein
MCDALLMLWPTKRSGNRCPSHRWSNAQEGGIMSEVPSSLTGMAVPAALYVNSVRIDYTQWDVTVDLLLITPAGDIPAEAGSQTTYATERVTRVIMSPMHAKALAESLGEAVKMWGGQIRPASRGWCVMTAGRGTEAVPFYSGSTASTSQVGAAGIVQPVVHPISGVMVPPPGPDRVAEWLHGEEASQQPRAMGGTRC